MHTLTITAKDFTQLVRPVIPHAERSETFPLLASVYLTTINKRLHAVATDRFTIGIQRAPQEVTAPKNLAAAIPIRAIRQILATFKPSRNVNPEITFEFTDTEVRVSTEGLDSGVFGGSTAAFTFHLAQGDYPPVARLFHFDEVPADQMAHTIMLNPSYMAKFAQALIHGEPMIMHPARKGKPLMVTVGIDFIGLIVPMRFAEGDTPVADEWADFAALANSLQEKDKKATKQAA